VLLDGHDGDTAVSDGLGRLRELVAESDRLQFCYEAWLYSNRLNKRFWPYLRAILLPSLVPPLFREIGRDLRRGQLGQTDPPVNFLNPEFARETDAFGRNATRLAAPPQYTSQRERHVQRLTGGFGSHASTVLAKMGRGLGIDPRHPFYDRRFLELCVALPSEFKLKDGWTRYILRKSFERIVPDVVRWRPGKTRLGRQFDKAFRGPDAAALKEIVRDQDRLLEPFVNMVELRSLLDRYMQTGSDKEGTQLWAAATLAIWLRETRGTGVHA
jgi:asparagine synthase (glutamine-hydrolysing)